jgi:anaerobic magnesium-protoporphyrin IX monomethyl ester cyclase
MCDVILAKLEGEQHSLLAPPFGILFLANSLEESGFSTKLYHELGTKENIQRLVALVAQERPLFVGLSTLTGLSLLPTAWASEAIKKANNVPIVWGGLHPTMLPEQTLENAFVDIVCIGEGEETITELAAVLREEGQQSEKMANVAGIAYKVNGKAVINESRSFIQELDEIYPAWNRLDAKRYYSPERNFYAKQGYQLAAQNIGALTTSRGCPWRCGFCYNQFTNKRIFRAQSAERIVNEIQHCKKQYGITAVVFEDDYFFANKKRGLEVIRQLDIPWSSNVRADHMATWGDEFAKEVSERNCMELRIGAESGSQRVLDIMQKDITVDQIRTAVALCVKYNIPVTTGFMLGIPGEKWSDSLETLNFMEELEKMGDNVKTLGPAIFMPYPGTPLFDRAIEDGFDPPSSLEEWSTSFWGPKQKLSCYQDKRIQFILHYKTLLSRKNPDRLIYSIPIRFLKYLAKLRWKYKFFRFPIDYHGPLAVLKVLGRLRLPGLSEKLRKEMWDI